MSCFLSCFKQEHRLETIIKEHKLEVQKIIDDHRIEVQNIIDKEVNIHRLEVQNMIDKEIEVHREAVEHIIETNKTGFSINIDTMDIDLDNLSVMELVDLIKSTKNKPVISDVEHTLTENRYY